MGVLVGRAACLLELPPPPVFIYLSIYLGRRGGGGGEAGLDYSNVRCQYRGSERWTGGEESGRGKRAFGERRILAWLGGS